MVATNALPQTVTIAVVMMTSLVRAETTVADGRNQIVVSPNGPADGGDFGPQTPNTKTSGLQEALDAAKARAKDVYLAGGSWTADKTTPVVYHLHETLRVPWALLFKQPAGNLLGRVSLSKTSFAASDTDPSILSVQAGAVVRDAGVQILPVRRLDILLYSSAGQYLGVMARLRDLLPGSYSFGITGRGPTSVRLAPGGYELRLAAWPTLPLAAKPTRAQISFRIE